MVVFARAFALAVHSLAWRGIVVCLVSLVSLVSLAWGAAWAAPVQAVDARDLPGGGFDLTPFATVLEDPTGALTLAQVRAPDVAARFAGGLGKAGGFNFGITPSAWWFRFTLANPGGDTMMRVLNLAYARLSHVKVYQVSADGAVREFDSGVRAPFASRPIDWREFAFPLHLPAQASETVYVRVQSLTAFIVPMRLWTPGAFERHMTHDYAAQAWYFGMATAMVLFNLLIFVWLRERIFLYYVAFALSMAFALAAQNGLVKQFMTFEPPWWSDLASTFGYSFAIATALQFMRHMLETWRTLARWDGGLRAMVWFFVLSPLVFPFTGQTWIKTAAVVYLGAILVLVAVLVRGILLRQRDAYFYGVAALMLAFGALANVLRAIGLVPTNLLTANAMQIGSALEMVLLALALADRYARIRREKVQMQKALLRTQNELIDNLRQSEQRLEQRVHERTLQLERANGRLAALSLTDGLTGIANRRHFDEALQSEWQRARRSGESISLALLDVDWFKAYNDHLGHQAGDECLRRVARVMADSVPRHTDMVARYGGEEFIVLAPGVTSAGMLLVCERIRAGLRALSLPHPTSVHGQVTVSMGVADVVPGQAGSIEDLLHRADDALYRAKEAGRDRIVVA